MAEQLVPGRELDALVAEMVMGWSPVSGGWRTSTGQIRTWESVSGVPGFKPSTDIVAAWQVVERLREQGLLVNVDTFANCYDAYVFNEAGEEIICFSAVATAPHAICLAALKAVANAPVASQEAPEHNARGLGHGDQDKPSETP
jgi:hypothetical protein